MSTHAHHAQIAAHLLTLPRPDPLHTEPGRALLRVIPTALARTLVAGKSETLDNFSNVIGRDRPPVSPVILNWVKEEAERLYGREAAETLLSELTRRNAVQTANHLGPSFSAEFFQGDLIFALGCRETVPLLAYGGVPFQNAGYPRGAMLSPIVAGTLALRRIPIMPPVGRRVFISSAAAVKMENVTPSVLPTAPSLTEKEQIVLGRVVERVYRDPRIMAADTLSDQLALIGSGVWAETVGETLPPVFMLDFQRLITHLVRHDLTKPDALATIVLTHPELALQVRKELANERGCWHFDETGKLTRGTLFFWAIDDESRAWPLELSEDGRSLVRVAEDGMRQSSPWVRLKAEDLMRMLDAGRLQPSLYLFAVSVVATHGLHTAGGTYQVQYVPAIAAGTRRALAAADPSGSRMNAATVTAESDYATGLIPIGIRAPSTQSLLKTLPAGAVEVMVRGGLRNDTVAALRRTTVADAMRPALAFHYEDIFPEAERTDEWLASLAAPAPIVLDD